MSNTLIYQEMAGDKLKLIAEVEDESNVQLAVDALLDEEPKLVGVELICFNSDDRTVVVAESNEPVQARRKMKVSGAAASGATASDSGDAPKKRRGRPPGSGAAKKPAAKAGAKRRGRPPGSKNKTTATTGAKRGPGRPPGSGAKKKPAAKKAAGRRGRPPGSKNKSTTTKAAGAKSIRSKGGFKKNIKSAE